MSETIDRYHGLHQGYSLTTLIGAQLDTMHEARTRVREAQAHLQSQIGDVVTSLLANQGGVLPLRGTAQSTIIRNGDTYFTVARGSMPSESIPYFSPWYYRIGRVGSEVVMLTEAGREIDDPKVGIAANIISLRIATLEEILDTEAARNQAEAR